MHPTDKAARVAGAIYLSMIFTAPFSLIYVPNTLIVRGAAAATAGKILAHETMFRLAIAAEMVNAVIFVLLGMAGIQAEIRTWLLRPDRIEGIRRSRGVYCLGPHGTRVP